jgi:hypothetical protein
MTSIEGVALPSSKRRIIARSTPERLASTASQLSPTPMLQELGRKHLPDVHVGTSKQSEVSWSAACNKFVARTQRDSGARIKARSRYCVFGPR